jgi:uncharacterized protein
MEKVIIQTLTLKELKNKDVNNWPIWEKEVSRFDWYYDCDEECFILKGEVTIETDEGNFRIHEGHFVTFKKGLKCVWNVIRPIRKHYNFQ